MVGRGASGHFLRHRTIGASSVRRGSRTSEARPPTWNATRLPDPNRNALILQCFHFHGSHPQPNIQGLAAIIVQALLLDGMAQASNALTQSATIEVFGLFPLVTPAGPLTNGYVLQVRDVSAAAAIAELEVQFNPSFSTDGIRFFL